MSLLSSRKFGALGCFLLALTAGLLAADCSFLKSGSGDTVQDGFAKLRAAARSVVVEPDRLNLFLAHSEELEAELLEFERYARDFAAEYRHAFTDYDSDQDDLRRLSVAFRDRQRAAQQRFVALHLAMAGTVTRSEWRSIQDQEARIIESMLNAALEETG